MSANLNSFWRSKNFPGILAATVDGSLTFFKQITTESNEFNEIQLVCPTRVISKGDYLFSTELWDLPLKDRPGGKGLKPINKAYYRGLQSRKNIIDYDMQEVSRSCFSYNSM